MGFGISEDLGLNPEALFPISQVTSEKPQIMSGCRESHLLGGASTPALRVAEGSRKELWEHGSMLSFKYEVCGPRGESEACSCWWWPPPTPAMSSSTWQEVFFQSSTLEESLACPAGLALLTGEETGT